MKSARVGAFPILASLAAAASAGPTQAPVRAIVGKSGYATIRTVPPSPTGEVESERPTYSTPQEWYAQENGISVAEATKRNAEQAAFRPILERLLERLRRLEPDNYVSARMNHQPDWSYTLYFKRDPETTLRRYSLNPRFNAAKASYTEAELHALVAPWGKRFAEAGIGTFYGLDPTESRVSMTIPVTVAAFREIARREEWGEVPPAIRLSFAQEHRVPRVDPRVAPLLRGFASGSLATTMQPEAGFSGRVILDDGCLRLAIRGKPNARGPLVVFHRETGIGLDAQGYLATIDRRTGKPTARIGEMWSWAGPNRATQFDGLEELKAACGDGPITNVGNPESEARFKKRNPGY